MTAKGRSFMFRALRLWLPLLFLSACTSNPSNTLCGAGWRTLDDYFFAGQSAIARSVAVVGDDVYVVGTTSDPSATAIVRRLLAGDFVWGLSKTYTDRTLLDVVAASTTRLYAVGKLLAGGWAVATSTDGTTWTDITNAQATGGAIRAIVLGTTLVVVGDQNAGDAILSQKLTVGNSALGAPVSVGNGRPAALWANGNGILFLLANRDGGADSRIYTSTDRGTTWTATALTIPVASSTKATLGGLGDQAYLSWVEGTAWRVGIASAFLDALSATRSLFPLPAGFTGYPRVALSARADEVLLAGDIATTGFSERWQTVLAGPVTTAEAVTDTYQLSGDQTAQVQGGLVLGGNYLLVGSAVDSNGDGHWITRRLTCSR